MNSLISCPSLKHRLPSHFRKITSLAFSLALLLFAFAAADVAAYADDSKTRSRAERALREGDYETAEKLFRELLGKDASDKPARLGLSYALLKRGSLQDAYDHAARVIATDPLSARAHALLGSSILASGDFRMAVEEFRTALGLKDNDPLAIAGMALISFYENRLDESIVGLRRAVFLDPREPDFIYNLAIAAARSERYKEAADAYERFLEIAPRYDEDRRARIKGLIDFLRYLGGRRSLYDIGGPERVDVPFEAPDGRPIIQVRVNGQREPFRFVLDTGSGMCVVSDRAAERLGMKPVARGGMARGFGGGGRFEIVYGFLSSLEIGGAKIESVPVYIRRFYDEKVPVDGYIGISAIAKFLTVVDYGAHTFSLVRARDNTPLSVSSMVFKNREGKVEPQPASVPLRTTSSGFLSSEVRLAGVDKPLNFIVDTGASISVISEKLTEDEEISRFAQATKMKVFGAAGIEENVGMLLLPRVQIGQHAREKVAAAVLDLDTINETTGFVQTGVLGGNFLRQYRLTFDFQRALLLLEPIRNESKQGDLPSSGSAAQPL
ncbi:MAG TPA: aspartyl protease family protein [Pyrinomonadaceae bacterium]|nr:aspartyl protease family protein [Pyrinomonadaceae bacterium]